MHRCWFAVGVVAVAVAGACRHDDPPPPRPLSHVDLTLDCPGTIFGVDHLLLNRELFPLPLRPYDIPPGPVGTVRLAGTPGGRGWVEIDAFGPTIQHWYQTYTFDFPAAGTTTSVHIALPAFPAGARLEPPRAFLRREKVRVIAAADFDRDGRDDLLVQRGWSVSLMRGRADGLLGPPEDSISAYGTWGQVADLDGDGHPDVLLDSGTACLSRANATWSCVSCCGNLGDRVAIVDVDGDGKLDLLLSNWAQLARGRGDGTFDWRAIPFARGVFGDVDGDGRVDGLVWRDSAGGWLHRGNGDGTFRDGVLFLPGNETTRRLMLADLDGDGLADLIVPGSRYLQPTTLSTHLNLGDGFGEPASHPTYDPTETLVRDLDGDGHPDVLSLSRFAETLTVLAGKGDGTLQAPVVYRAGIEPDAIVLGDFDGDGRLDVAISSGVSGGGGLVVLRQP